MNSIFAGVFGFTLEKNFTQFLHTNQSKIKIKLLSDFKQKILKAGYIFYGKFYTFDLDKNSISRCNGQNRGIYPVMGYNAMYPFKKFSLVLFSHFR